MTKTINVIDLFAGPGGLGEGFSAFEDDKGNRPFKIRMSVEKEVSAHKTLTTRAFSRLFSHEDLPEEYHLHLQGKLSQEELFEAHTIEAKEALSETLETPTALGDDNDKIFSRIRKLKKQHRGSWIVIGGPPCQAYSLAGRSRNKGIKGYKPEADDRHYLYKEYLKVLYAADPEIFVMENVKGILTAKVGGRLLFPTIVRDLENPGASLNKRTRHRYRIHSFVTKSESDRLDDESLEPHDFVIRSELYGVPQARHRVILLGVREDINAAPGKLLEHETITTGEVIGPLPPLRSKLSKEPDTDENWLKAIQEQARLVSRELKTSGNRNLGKLLGEIAKDVRPLPTSAYAYRGRKTLSTRSKKPVFSWLVGNPPRSLLNHESRGHIRSDLGRYLFNAAWTQHYGVSAKAEDFPDILKPAHKNWKSGHFSDRFRVQTKSKPSTTITSHISKDGHYYIHFDPTQCRSLTVREAARLQTFPDNYFFEGNRTQQYVQVGNAVPPFLASNISSVIANLLK